MFWLVFLLFPKGLFDWLIFHKDFSGNRKSKVLYSISIEDNYSWSMCFLDFLSQQLRESCLRSFSYQQVYLVTPFLHIHSNEDEIFYLCLCIIESNMRLFHIDKEILTQQYHNNLHIFFMFQFVKTNVWLYL